MTQTVLQTSDACEIAGVEPARLNEAIHAKNYRSAPHTDAGSVRKFDRDAVTYLLIYGWLGEQGLQPRIAGAFVSLIQGAVETHRKKRGSKPQDLIGDVVISMSRSGKRIAYVGEVAPVKLSTSADPLFLQLVVPFATFQTEVAQRIASKPDVDKAADKARKPSARPKRKWGV